ncbi:protein transport protein sec73 [Rhypophila decipiens]
MPFLRRRGNMASESDMRRHTIIADNVADSNEAISQPTSSHPSPIPEHSVPVLSLPQEEAEDVKPPPSATTTEDDAMSSTSSHRARMSTGDVPADRTLFPPVQDQTNKYRRFSMLRFRNASDSQLAAKAKLHAAGERPPPLPRPPEIITTAPTLEINVPRKKSSRIRLASRLRKSGELPRIDQADETGDDVVELNERWKARQPEESMSARPSVTFDEPKRPSSSQAPPAYGDEGSSTLALPVNRLSESSRSDASSGDRLYGSTTTTTHTVSTTTTIFRLPRRKRKQPEPLFPIAHLQPKHSTLSTQQTNASHSSLSVPTSSSPDATPRKSLSNGNQLTPTPSRPNSVNGIATPPSSALTLFANKSNASPATAFFRPASRNSGQSSPTRTYLHKRGRSSTLSSLNRPSPRVSVDEHLALPAGRTSTSGGRKSIGDFLGLNRLRQNPETSSGRLGNLTPATPGSSTSKNNSLQLPRDSIILPERRDDDTPARYLERLLEVISRSVIAACLSKGTDTFAQSVLRSYMRSFKFFEDPMDMAIRKLLMEAELPKETQQIDRCLQAFANRYHECNPGVYSTPDQAYFIAFSLLILHTDVFNKNNKHKMQKADYLKNTRGEGIFDEILEVFYDNITYTPFIHVEDDLDINGERIITHKAKKKSIFPNSSPDPVKRAAKEPIDPYTLIIDNRLDILRPNLKEVMNLEDHYSYTGTANSLNLGELQRTFFKTGVLQIVSARSRPDAFMSERTATNPEEAHPGIVDIKITKVGLLWRKDQKKKKTRSPWQEWGAILTGAQLYFFRNTTWIKSLMHQYDEHVKKGHGVDPCIFKPPLEQFKPDALMSTDGAVALMDSSYKKHKHAFVYVRHGGLEEVLLADDEEEMNDWLAKLNYAAAFRSSGVRMRGVIGGSYDGQSRRAIRRLDTDNAQSIQTPTGEVMVSRSRIDHKMAQDILAARRDIMYQKVADANEQLQKAEKTLEAQLRNSRHLMILAPIHPKTRENMLLAAARLSAQVKWTRMEIWKLKCHRDILLMDLEEERKSLGGPMDPRLDAAVSAREKLVINPNLKPDNGSVAPRSPRSPGPSLITRTSTVTGRSDDQSSPRTEVFQTPPTSATGSSFHRHQNSWELPGLTFEHVDLRKGSVSSVVSSSRSITATPPRNVGSSSSAPEAKFDQLDVDADERDLLKKAGLIETGSATNLEQQRTPGPAREPEDGQERRDRHSSSTPATDKHDRNKIRRSLQRTLREGAGHISHHRSRKGKESISITSGSDEAAALDSADVLTRGTGSFVVHGKKASVITFGNELQYQAMSADERIRIRKQKGEDGLPASATAPSAMDGGARGSNTDFADFRSVLTARSDAATTREHRDSAASASTATARSFRELHRKYSSAQQHQQQLKSVGGGSLRLPSDAEDSDAAVSFSDGRRTPLPPIEGDEDEKQAVVDADENENQGKSAHGETTLTCVGGVGDGASEEGETAGVEDQDGKENRHTRFFTPEPRLRSPIPSPPPSEKKESSSHPQTEGQDDHREDDENTSSPVTAATVPSSPPIQPVGA